MTLWVEPYWRRLWIVQEFLLAKDLVLQWGEHIVSWSLFLERFRCCVDVDPMTPFHENSSTHRSPHGGLGALTKAVRSAN